MLEDLRPAMPDTWEYKPRNTLLFPAEAFQPNEAQRAAQDLKLLTDGPTGKRCGAATRAPKTIVYNNSRFPDVEPETKQDIERQGPQFDFVPMTPSITPQEATPMMTWGKIEGTPMILDATPGPEARTFTAPTYISANASSLIFNGTQVCS